MSLKCFYIIHVIPNIYIYIYGVGLCWVTGCKAQNNFCLRQECTNTSVLMAKDFVFSQWICLKHIKVG